MKKLFLFAAIVFTVFLLNGGESANGTQNFFKGEVIDYKVHYGFINAAEGRMSIAKELKTINGFPCFEVLVEGKSIGMFDLFLRIRDEWGTYIDTAKIIPHQFYRKIEEGSYRKHEIVTFDYTEETAIVKKYHFRDQYWRPLETYDIPDNVQDLVSSYYFMRTLDFNEYEAGDTIITQVFFDDEIYNFNIRYLGKDHIKTKIGKFETLVLSPIMPENKLFKGENSIRVWLSADEKKIPLKVKASMFLGAIEVDIKSYDPGIQ